MFLENPVFQSFSFEATFADPTERPRAEVANLATVGFSLNLSVPVAGRPKKRVTKIRMVREEVKPNRYFVLKRSSLKTLGLQGFTDLS